MESELDNHLNAYGAAVFDNETCPVHRKVECEEKSDLYREDKAFKEENHSEPVSDDIICKSNRSSTFNQNSVETPDRKDIFKSVPKRNPTSSAGVSNNGSITSSEEDFEDFIPSKKYRLSSDVQNSPHFIKLGVKKNVHSVSKNSSLHTLHHQRLTDDLRDELLNSPSDVPGLKKNLQKEFSSSASADDLALNKNKWCTCSSNKQEKIKKEPSNSTLPTKLPTIYFGTRTHKQIEQIIRELKKTIYKDTKMTILSSRERSCIHPEASCADNKNEACDELIKADGGPTCRYFHNAKTISHYHPNKLLTAFDLEDFVKICKQVKACPYFGSRELLTVSDIVFCPYNYLVDPLIRSAMSINLKGSIIIMDEAHNIEDSARSAASGSFSLSSFEEGSINLEKVGRHSKTIRDYYLYFSDIFKNIAKWLTDNIGNLTDYKTFDSSSKVYIGDDMIAVLSYVKIGPDTFPEFQKRFEKILSEENESEKEVIDMDKPKLLSSTLNVLKNLSQILTYIYKDNLVYIPDYRCVVMKTIKASPRNFAVNRNAMVLANRSNITLNFWCLNPAVAFSDIKGNIHSLIVASGTLSPLTSFQSELGIPFQTTLEANHVVSKSQMWVGTIGRGPNNVCLNATFANSATFAFQDDMGNLVLEVCRIIPHGILCFLPSYSMMDKLVSRWQQTGLWERLTTQKTVLCEPRKNQDFVEVITEFYDAVKESEKSTGTDMTGALFFAVCRGKVSEGLDFADNNARAVITIGIPFPSIKDAQVDLKKKYNDQYAAQKKITTGSEWYEIQAFRAINQALGRCIRHRDDFGALIIVDERFQKNNRYQNSLSKWIRKEIEHYSTCKDALNALCIFADKTGLRNLNQINEDIS